MSKIHKLTDEVVNRIAAGEVIERPAYAIKELIENSIDASATRINIEIEDEGLTSISVFDNGIGIEKDDLKLVLQRHTTSKISNFEDLDALTTLGFRGEALASIASISEIKVKSNGWQISNTNKKISKIGMPEGTIVEIRSLFASTPARRKFLKSKENEYRQILSQIQSFALNHPEISFTFVRDNKTIYNLPASSLEERITEILGETVANFSIPISLKDSYIKINGFISHPQVSFKTKNKMLIYINDRRIHNTSLITSIKESYKNLLQTYDYPFVYLKITLPKEFVDANVHPKKEIVKILNEETVLQTLRENIFETLTKHNLTFSNSSWKTRFTKTDLAKSLREQVSQTAEYKIAKVKKNSDIIQLHNLYLVTETENGILLLDQHAVHEAILYYKFKQAYLNKKSKKFSVKISKPKLIKLTSHKASLASENLEYLNKIGFEIEQFNETSFKLYATPLVATDLDPETNLNETLEEIESENKRDVEANINTMLSYLSCRSAIKSGDKLTKKQMKELLRYLDKIDLGYTCPHGRPVKVELTKQFLEKLFLRS